MKTSEETKRALRKTMLPETWGESIQNLGLSSECMLFYQESNSMERSAKRKQQNR
jgi:hypothetical protein